MALLLVAGLAWVLPPAQAHPFHLQIQNDILDSPKKVRDDQWISQSFVPSSSFVVSRISLYVRDTAQSDALTVSLRPDAAGLPANSTLTSGTADGPDSPVWLDVDLAPYVTLTAGQSYWIVAHSNMGGNGGYEWWRSPDDAAYPDGTAFTSANGTYWSPEDKDYSFRVYGFADPSFSLSVQVSNSTLVPGQTAVFGVNFTNIGIGTAPAVWVNVSLPPELTYVDDDAWAIGGVRNGTYAFTFTNVTPGSYVFNLTAAANGGVADGTVTVTSFELNATDHAGAPLAQLTGNVVVTIENARLTVSIVSTPSIVEPGDLINNTATVTSAGSTAAMNILISGLVDTNATYISSFPPTSYDSGVRAVQWPVSVLNPGQSVVLEWTVAVAVGTPDFAAVVSTAVAAYEDVTGTPMPSESAAALATVQAPSFAPALLLDRYWAEYDDEILATLFYNNTGSRSAQGAWADWNLEGHYELLSLVPVPSFTPLPDGFRVQISDVSPGPHFLVARLRVLPSMVDGLMMQMRVSFSATDAKGNPLQDSFLMAAVELYAPAASLFLETNDAEVDAGAVFSLTISVVNLGRAEGNGGLSLTLPPGVSYLSDNGTFAVASSYDTVTWTIPSLPVGSNTTLQVTLKKDKDPGIESFRFSLSLTDEAGSPPITVFSNAVSVEFVPAASILGVWWAALIGLVLGGLAFIAYRRRKSELILEDVFVADLGGLLLAHKSASIVSSNDEDLVAAMFMAIQEFVRDSFSRGTDERIRALEFGERKILVERGRTHFVAVVYRGVDSGELEEKVRRVSKAIDERFGDIIATWDGSSDAVRGISHLLPTLWKKRRSGAST